MTTLTRRYLADKTSESWAQPMRRWSDAFTPERRATLVDQTPIHDQLMYEVYEAKVEEARREVAKEVHRELEARDTERMTPSRRTRHRRSRWRRK